MLKVRMHAGLLHCRKAYFAETTLKPEKAYYAETTRRRLRGSKMSSSSETTSTSKMMPPPLEPTSIREQAQLEPKTTQSHRPRMGLGDVRTVEPRAHCRPGNRAPCDKFRTF